jgi:DNA-binding NarL/FixJ family response regulator
LRSHIGDVSVILADDHPVFLHGLCALVGQTPGFEVMESHIDGVSVLRSIRKFEPKIAVLGLAMSGLSGIEVLKHVESEGIETRVVFLALSATDKDIVAAVTNGAWGIVPKQMSTDAVTDCLAKVAGGERWLPPELVGPAMSREAEWRSESDKIESLLTNRELEISLLVAEGLSNKHIARRVGISEGTVKIHLYNAYRKLGGMNRASLTTLVYRYHRGEPSKPRTELPHTPIPALA